MNGKLILTLAKFHSIVLKNHHLRNIVVTISI